MHLPKMLGISLTLALVVFDYESRVVHTTSLCMSSRFANSSTVHENVATSLLFCERRTVDRCPARIMAIVQTCGRSATVRLNLDVIARSA